MKLKIYLTAVLTFLILMSCTPELDDDYIRIDFSKNSQYQRFYLDTSAVLVKVNYYAALSRNSVFIQDTIFTANALYYRSGDLNPWIYYYTFGKDSNLTAVKRIGSRIYFRYQDSLLYSVNLLMPADSTSLTAFDPILYPDTLVWVSTDEADIDYIDSLNNSAKWYKPYSQWQDEIINLYR